MYQSESPQTSAVQPLRPCHSQTSSSQPPPNHQHPIKPPTSHLPASTPSKLLLTTLPASSI
jgi:hypothetical protein